jgi:hypothetical protein
MVAHLLVQLNSLVKPTANGLWHPIEVQHPFSRRWSNNKARGVDLAVQQLHLVLP